MSIVDSKKELGTVKLIIGIWRCLSKKRKTQLIFCIFLSILSAISEVFSITVIFPFLSAAIEPAQINRSKLLVLN